LAERVGVRMKCVVKGGLRVCRKGVVGRGRREGCGCFDEGKYSGERLHIGVRGSVRRQWAQGVCAWGKKKNAAAENTGLSCGFGGEAKKQWGGLGRPTTGDVVSVVGGGGKAVGAVGLGT